MDIVDVLRQFALDDKLAVLLLVIAADLVFGVAAAVKLGTFALSYVGDFLRTDILGKVVPYFGLYAMDKVTHGADLVIPGLDFGVLAMGAYGVLMAQMVGSIVSSLADLGINVPPALGRGEKATGVLASLSTTTLSEGSVPAEMLTAPPDEGDADSGRVTPSRG